MKCVYCGENTKVMDSRVSKSKVRRRRECLNCNKRFTTIEKFVAESNSNEAYIKKLLKNRK